MTTEREALIQAPRVAAFRHTITPVDGEIRVVFSPEIENPFPGEQYLSYSREPLVLLHDVLTNAADPPALPEGWVGCGECDVAFPCHNGQYKCLRLNPEPPNPQADAFFASAVRPADKWALVPKEPTEEMIEAVSKVMLDRIRSARDGRGIKFGIVENWQTMIAAAPKVPR